jgi:hypothetical protein
VGEKAGKLVGNPVFGFRFSVFGKKLSIGWAVRSLHFNEELLKDPEGGRRCVFPAYG